MTIQDAYLLVIEVLTEIQVISGRELEPIDATCVPLRDLRDFSSFNSLEATNELAAKSKKDIPLTENICWDKIKCKQRNVQEMAEALLIYSNSPE
jgi:hypothetical protein